MRIVRFEFKDAIYIGELVGDTIFELSQFPWNGGTKTSEEFSLDSVKLLAPCEPKKIIATAINYPGATGLKEKQDEPLVFLKPSSSVIGPNDRIISPFKNLEIWGECELAVVIGKTIKNASYQEAKDAIFGYSIGNDVSANNILDWDHHLARSKGMDTFCVIGPWIDTEFCPENQKITGFHNKTLMREGVVGKRLSQEPDLLVKLSKWMTLEAGDVILTGAPSRVIDRIYFSEGDSFTCKIEGLGEITNHFSISE